MEFRLIKKVTYKGPLKNEPSEIDYWRTRHPEERIAAVEFLRQSLYGKTTPRLQRVYKIVIRKI